MLHLIFISFFFFFNDTATTEIYTLSLHDALPIYSESFGEWLAIAKAKAVVWAASELQHEESHRSEEHTSELPSHSDLVCRLLLEKKKKKQKRRTIKIKKIIHNKCTDKRSNILVKS